MTELAHHGSTRIFTPLGQASPLDPYFVTSQLQNGYG